MSRVLNRDSRWDRVIGHLRMLAGQCPRCNSDAPAVDTCFVCKNVANGRGSAERNNRQQYPPTRETKAMWWYSWMHASFPAMQREYEKGADANE